MVSKLFIKCDNKQIESLYTGLLNQTNLHSVNLFFIENITINPNQTKTIDLGIKCDMKEIHQTIKSINTNIKSKDNLLDLFVCIPYWVIPNNFLGKTTLLPVCTPMIVEPNISSYETIKVVLYNYGAVPVEIKKGHQYFKIACSNLQAISKVIIQ